MNEIVKVEQRNLPANPKMFLQEYSVINCMEKFSKVTTPLLALKTESVTIASLRKRYSADWIRAYIAGWIINMNEFLNVNRPMNENQIEETAWLIAQKFYYLNVSDITLLFNRAKMGEYGPLYESLDGSKILAWFDKYAAERAQLAETETLRDHEKVKQDPYKRTSDTSDIKALNSKARGLYEHHKANNPKPETRNS